MHRAFSSLWVIRQDPREWDFGSNGMTIFGAFFNTDLAKFYFNQTVRTIKYLSVLLILWDMKNVPF